MIPSRIHIAYSLRARFDSTLTLEHIEVLELDGSMGPVCKTAELSLKGLIGSRVGSGFGAKAKEVTRGPNSCMHFLPLLQQISTAAFRAQQVLILESEGKEAFIEHNKKTYRDRCVGYSVRGSK